MKIELPIPYYIKQANVEYSQYKYLTDIEFLIIMIFYGVEKKEIKRSDYLVDVLKEKLNLDKKWLDIVEEIINELLKTKTLQLIDEPTKDKIKLDDNMMGEFKLNEQILNNIDNNHFISLKTDKKQEIKFVYKSIVNTSPEHNEYITNDKLDEYTTKNVDDFVNIDEIDIKDLQLKNIVENKIKIPKDWLIANIDLLEPIKKFIIKPVGDAKLEVNKIVAESNINSILNSSLKYPKMYDYLVNELKKQLSCAFHKYYDDEPVEIIAKTDPNYSWYINNEEEIGELFNNFIEKLVIKNNKFYLVGQINKVFDLKLKDKDEQLEIPLLSIHEFNENWDNFIEKHFNFEVGLNYPQLKRLGDVIVELVCNNIIKKLNNGLKDKNKYFNFLNVIPQFNIESLKNIHLDETDFNSNNLHPILKKYLINNSEKDKYINEFYKFDMNQNLEIEINKIYQFDYTKIKRKIFKNSIDETNLWNLKEYINKVKNIDKKDHDELEKIKKDINDYKNKFTWIDCDDLIEPILNQITKLLDVKVEELENDNFVLAKDLRFKIEEFLKQKIGSNDIKKIDEIKSLDKADKKIIIEIKKYTNSFLHHDDSVIKQNIETLMKYKEQLNEYQKKLKEVLVKNK